MSTEPTPLDELLHHRPGLDSPGEPSGDVPEDDTRPGWRNALDWALTIAATLGVILLIKWWGVSLNTVATDSMMPTYKPTDIVIMVSPERVPVGVGTPIVFETEFNGTHIPPHVHRIVEANPDGTWRTRGDNNDAPDPWVVHREGIKGVVIASVPGALLRSPFLIGGLIFVIAAVAFWPRADDPDEPGDEAIP